MPRYIFRFDDIAPTMNWERYFELGSLFAAHGATALLGVIPDNHDPALLEYPLCDFDFWEHIRERRSEGWDVAVHGYRHVYDTTDPGILRINARSEFAGHPYEVQHERLGRARAILRDNGVETDTFMAPGHSFDRITLRALVDNGYRSITDGYGLYPIRSGGLLFVPQLLARPRPLPLGVLTFCLHPNTMSDAQVARVGAFLDRHAGRVIPFHRSEEHVRPAWSQKPVEVAVGSLLVGVRRARRWRARTSP